jgi:hypothetical protein
VERKRGSDLTAQRSTSNKTRGKHQPLVAEKLLNRCAELPRQQTTTKHPGRRSQPLVLKSIHALHAIS